MAKRIVKSMLEDYAKYNPARYHMPGHKGSVSPFDVTEVSATDNLNSPETFYKDAHAALKNSYNSAESYFMVNGATGAIHAMIKYASQVKKGNILISRNCHKSIHSACMLFNIDAYFMDDKFDDTMQVFIHQENAVINSIKNTDNLVAVVIAPVDYYGRVMNVEKISALCKKRDALLLCDEAHGAHFHISEMLPKSLLPYADICVHSPHKTLSALTQCAYVHISKSVDKDKFENVMHSLQTTSPSFLLAKSMDDARYFADNMKADWEKRILQAEKLSAKLNEIDGIKVLDKKWAQKAGYYDKDKTRLVIDISEIGSGIEIGKCLEEDYGIFMEMYTFKHIVGILTPWDNTEWDNRLYIALKQIAKGKHSRVSIPKYPKRPKPKMSIAAAAGTEWQKVKLKNSAGKVATQPIGVYPPGVPLVLPGEVIDANAIEYMNEVKRLGGSLFGIKEGYINCIKAE